MADNKDLAERRLQIKQVVTSCLKTLYPGVEFEITHPYNEEQNAFDLENVAVTPKNLTTKNYPYALAFPESINYELFHPLLVRLYPDHELDLNIFPTEFFVDLQKSLQLDRKSREESDAGRYVNAVEDFLVFKKDFNKLFPSLAVDFCHAPGADGVTPIPSLQFIGRDEDLKEMKDRFLELEPPLRSNPRVDPYPIYSISDLAKNSAKLLPPDVTPVAPPPPAGVLHGYSSIGKGDQGDKKAVDENTNITKPSSPSP